MPTDNPALALWRAAGLKEVTLPSGTRVRVRVPDATTLIRNDALPAELLAIATKFTTSGVDTDELTEEQLLAFVDFGRHMAASCVRDIADENGDWLPLKLTGPDLDELDLPPEDLEALQQIALRARTPAQITARSTGATPDSEEAGGTVDGWAAFRGQREGPDPGAGGADVRAEPGDDVPPSSGSRAGRGRGRGPRGPAAGSSVVEVEAEGPTAGPAVRE